jgi:TRAP-type C4-dicarboxylate transport system substrate-binding protein
MKRLGALPVAMPQSDVPDALQKGVVQGNVSSAEVLKDMNYAAYCPRVFKTDLCVISFAVVMNRSAYEALPADVKAVFDNLYREQAEWTGRYVDGHAEEAIAWARTNRNLTVTVPDEADTATLRATAQPLIDDYVSRMAAKGIDGRAVIDFITTRR